MHKSVKHKIFDKSITMAELSKSSEPIWIEFIHEKTGMIRLGEFRRVKPRKGTIQIKCKTIIDIKTDRITALYIGPDAGDRWKASLEA